MRIVDRLVWVYSVEKRCFQNYEFYICDLLPISYRRYEEVVQSL
jgi:hypothetical protein